MAPDEWHGGGGAHPFSFIGPAANLTSTGEGVDPCSAVWRDVVVCVCQGRWAKALVCRCLCCRRWRVGREWASADQRCQHARTCPGVASIPHCRDPSLRFVKRRNQLRPPSPSACGPTDRGCVSLSCCAALTSRPSRRRLTANKAHCHADTASPRARRLDSTDASSHSLTPTHSLTATHSLAHSPTHSSGRAQMVRPQPHHSTGRR